MPVRKNVFLSTLVLSASLQFTQVVIAADAKPADPTSNPTPTSLSLTPLENSTALIKAEFAHAERGGAVEVRVGDQIVTLSDSGEGGDEHRGDGIFSAQTEVDFVAFVEANRQFAEIHQDRENPLFSQGGRQLLGNRRVSVRDDLVSLSDWHFEGEDQQFELPLSLKRIEFGRELQLPVRGLALALPGTVSAAAAPASIPHSLMITDLNVVNDHHRTWACTAPGQAPSGNPHGEWTFWTLMRNISNGTSSTSDYIKQLFQHWTAPQVINSHTVNARPHVYNEIIRQWELRSGGPGAPLLPEHSPFRLLGIVLRLDLRGGGSAYGGGDAGEGRFVFTLHDGHCNNLGKTIILEYKVPIAGCHDVRNWAQKWKALATSSNYNSDLAALTHVFSAAGANPAAPNQSAIGQIRTNEFLPPSPFWELKEFVLPASGGFLQQTTVKQEPDINHNNSNLLATFLNNEWPNLVGPPPGQHTVTDLYTGVPFLAGAAPAPVLWDVPNSLLTVPTSPSPNTAPPATIRDDAKFELALNTCSGCHTVETNTPFAHLDYNTPVGQPAFLSGFLTGTSLPDPRQPSVTRSFNDLARRAADLDHVAAMACDMHPVAANLGNFVLHELSAPQELKAVH